MKATWLMCAVMVIGFSACRPDNPVVIGIGPTGGVVTIPDNSASLTIPAGTFSAPVQIKLEKPAIVPPVPLEYEALTGGAFTLSASAEFAADQNVTLEIEDSALTGVNGKRLSVQALADGAFVAALVKRPADADYQMLQMKRVNAKWQVEIWKEYVCRYCEIIATYFTPSRMEINLANTVPEGSAVQASLTLFNSRGEPLSWNYQIQLWSSDDSGIASVSTTGLVTGIKLGQTSIRAKAGKLGTAFLADKTIQVVGKPVVFTADFNAKTIKGYSRGQLSSSGNPSPAVTLTMPNDGTPNDLEFDSSQNLWVSDNANNRILRFSPSDYAASGSPVPSVIISSNANNSIVQPVGLAFDTSGHLWVANNTSLVRFNASSLGASGTPSPDRTITGTPVNFPGGLAVDSSNNLWVAMFGTNKVHRWTPSEQSAGGAPGYTISPNQKPAGLTFDANGNLYVGQIGDNNTSGIAVYLAAQLTTNEPIATRTLGLTATNQVYGVAFDPNINGIWANNQLLGQLIGFSQAQLGTATTTPAVVTGGATTANNGYGGVATLSNSSPANTRPSINSFTANPNALAAGGGMVTFNWNVIGATSLSIDQGVGVVTGSSTTRNISTTTTFTLTATNANGSTVSSPALVTVNVPGRKIWHASYKNTIRGYALDAAGNAAALPAITLNVSACNAQPNDLVQDNAGNIIFTDNNGNASSNRVILLASSVVTRGGAVAANECQVLETGSGGFKEFIGLALDTDGRSLFFGSSQGVRYLKFNGAAYTKPNLPILNAARTISGLHLAGNRLYAVDYNNFDYNGAVVRVFDLDQNRNADAVLRLTFKPSGNLFALPEGIAIAANRLWVANNSGDNLMGFALTDVNAIAPGTQNAAVAFVSLNRATANDVYLHCPGGLATAPNGELWVNVQGASAGNATCFTNPSLEAGSIYKYSTAILNFPAAITSKTDAPTRQMNGIASVPGFGGLYFGK